MEHAGSARQTLLTLEASGVIGSRVRWERLLVISYANLVEPRSNIVDVGGKKGRHVAVFLDRLGAERVYVFEPNPAMTAILRRRYGARRNLEITETALAERAGSAEFVINLGAPGESGLRQRAFSNPDRARIQRITVPVGRLDDQTFEGPIHYVKIDVEGAEIGVLRGGRDFLARHRPILSEAGELCRLRSAIMKSHDARLCLDLFASSGRSTSGAFVSIGCIGTTC